MKETPPPASSNHEQLAEAPAEDPPVVVEEEEEEFPLAELARLDEMINRPRWVVPVLAKGELEVLLEASIRLCRQGKDRCIMKNCERLVELCVTKLHQDWFPLLDLLAMVLNPHNKFHSYNGTRPSDSVPPGSQISDDQVFARPVDTRTPKGWVVDLINRFGNLGGLQHPARTVSLQARHCRWL
ncbi:hypothetical protein MRX96_004514 [Rhipicephalus microplus]